jgi:hypothetical protein
MSVTLHGSRARKKMRGMRGRWILTAVLLCLCVEVVATSGTALAQTVGPTTTGVGDAGSADGGPPWSTIVTAILVALLAGGVVGNLFASKRRRAPRLSVYEAIERRIRPEHDPNRDG